MCIVAAGSRTPLEVISLRLRMAVAGIARDPGRDKEVLLLFGILHESGMSAEDACNVVQKHRGDPNALYEAGMPHLADWVKEVLSGIESRQDKLPQAA